MSSRWWRESGGGGGGGKESIGWRFYKFKKTDKPQYKFELMYFISFVDIQYCIS